MKRVLTGSIQSKSTPIMASHIYIRDTDIKQALASDMFEFMNDAYKYIGGFRSFTGEDDFVDKSYLWYVTYDGEQPKRTTDIDIHKVLTVTVFKQKFGLKMVGIGNNRFPGLPDDERLRMKKRAKSAINSQIKFAATRGWAEVSGAAEKLFDAILPASYIIEPETLLELGVFKDIEIAPDNLHYVRTLSNGMEVMKVAYGNIRA